jgi:outer membrane protein TolC
MRIAVGTWRGTWRRVCSLIKNQTIAVSLVEQQREIVTLTQSQAKVGLASDIDVKSATAQLVQTEAQLPQYDQQIAQALNALAYLVGEAPGALEAELATPAAVPPVPPAVPLGLPSTLARRRPDIRRAEANLHAATANVGVAVAQFYPDVSLSGQAGTRATNASDLSRWSHLFYSFGPSISLPIFEGGAGIQFADVEGATGRGRARLSEDRPDGAARRGQRAGGVSHRSGATRGARRQCSRAAGVLRSGARQL